MAACGCLWRSVAVYSCILMFVAVYVMHVAAYGCIVAVHGCICVIKRVVIRYTVKKYSPKLPIDRRKGQLLVYFTQIIRLTKIINKAGK